MLFSSKHFGFGQNFIKWIKIISSRVNVNVFLSDSIVIQWGVRQGCPLSALLYVLCIEGLAVNIRKCTDIKGDSLRNRTFEQKVTMYADDMNVAVRTEKSIYELFNLTKKYEMATNSKVNKDKTEALWLGKWVGRMDTPLDLKWTQDEVKFLGVYIGNDRKKSSLRSFEEIK